MLTLSLAEESTGIFDLPFKPVSVGTPYSTATEVPTGPADYQDLLQLPDPASAFCLMQPILSLFMLPQVTR